MQIRADHTRLNEALALQPKPIHVLVVVNYYTYYSVDRIAASV